MKLKNNQQGFTLLELLVVVAVMAVIAGAAMMSMSGQEEHAGQGVAMHTMQVVENAENQFVIINKKIPDNLESMLCTISTATTTNGMTTGLAVNPADPDTQDNTPLLNNAAGTGTAAAVTAANARIFGGLSDAGLTGGGLSNAYASKLIAVDIPADGVAVLTNAGLSTLKFADANGCDDLETTLSGSDDASDVALDEYPLVNSAFDLPGEGGGFGVNVTLDPAATAPMMMYEEPTEIGANEKDIIVVLGIGNSSQLVTDGSFLAKAPRDGNVSGDKYGHFSLAFKIGEYQSATTDNVTLTQTETVTGGVSDNKGITWLDTPELIAALDADGDYYEGEIAEFAGLEDE
ncbi:MAG: prepilin-type N-terminal cleavage/methylation domain-containing protein [Methylomarinum sp.]|nr:prepilin-type N-terminal cleavage/methylation domain-containing protein [Methylomarinum sp.]